MIAEDLSRSTTQQQPGSIAMSSDWSIEQPQILFALPHPVDQTSGCIRGGPTYGFHGSKKRKRAEIVIGVDGECLNVYNVKNPRLLTSHALPPRTYLTSSPACAYRRASEQRPGQRFTYAATRNDLGGIGRKELLCFQDDITNTTTIQVQPGKTPLKWTWDLTNIDSEIAHIEPLPVNPLAAGSESHDILLVLSNGDMTVLSDNLQLEKIKRTTTVRVAADTTGSHCDSIPRVDLVSIQTVSDARNGLLKGRPDLTANMLVGSTVVLLVLSLNGSEASRGRQYIIQICSIPPYHLDSQSTHTTHSILSYCLPCSPITRDINKYKAQFAYDKTSASLYQLDQGTVSVYGLSFTTPKITSRFRIAHGRDSRLIPVSRSIILVTSGNRCALYDTLYGSLQAAKTVRNSSYVSTLNQKRKRSNGQNGENPIAIWFTYSNLGFVLGLMGRDLVSLGVSTQSKRRNQDDHSQLINSLGMTRDKSRSLKSYFELEPPDTDDLISHGTTTSNPAWAEVVSALSSLSPPEKAERFDQFFFDNLSSFMDSSDDLPKRCTHDVALKAISVIFDCVREGPHDGVLDRLRPPCVKLAFTPRKTLEWIIKSGNLTAQNLGKALIDLLRAGNESVRAVVETDLVGAIAAADTQLSLLALLVASKMLGLSGSVESFRILLGSFDSGQNVSANGLLKMLKPDQAANASEEELQYAAAQELQVASSILNDDFDARGSALKLCLERLGTCFPPTELVQAFRQQLTQRENLMLIELLRIELDQAGWTSRRLDFHPSYDATESQNEAIAVICKLLNCALDAMGTAGWLAERDSMEADNLSTLISLLRAETSAVLEGVQEATFFAGFLRDLVRFENAQAESFKKSRRKGSNKTRLRVRSRMLPLGLKGAQGVSSTKVGAGGELQKLSARRIGLEASRRKGKYEFEKIRV